MTKIKRSGLSGAARGTTSECTYRFRGGSFYYEAEDESAIVFMTESVSFAYESTGLILLKHGPTQQVRDWARLHVESCDGLSIDLLTFVAGDISCEESALEAVRHMNLLARSTGYLKEFLDRLRAMPDEDRSLN